MLSLQLSLAQLLVSYDMAVVVTKSTVPCFCRKSVAVMSNP